MEELSTYKVLSDNNLTDFLSGSGERIILVFSAPWSGNAVMTDTILASINKEFKGLVDFYKSDIEANPEVKKFFNVSEVPTILFLKDGVIRSILKGMVARHKIVRQISEVFPNAIQ